jgi:hypothetical protein
MKNAKKKPKSAAMLEVDRQLAEAKADRKLTKRQFRAKLSDNMKAAIDELKQPGAFEKAFRSEE